MLFTPCCLFFDGLQVVETLLFVVQVPVTFLAPSHILRSEPAPPFQNVKVDQVGRDPMS